MRVYRRSLYRTLTLELYRNGTMKLWETPACYKRLGKGVTFLFRYNEPFPPLLLPTFDVTVDILLSCSQKFGLLPSFFFKDYY